MIIPRGICRKEKKLWSSVQGDRQDDTRVRLVHDKLFVNGEVYTWDDETASRVRLNAARTPPYSGEWRNDDRQQARAKTQLCLICINAQSILNKKERLEHVLMLYDPHVTVISETWLNTDIPDCDIFPPSYNSFRRDRVSRGGGVAILVKKAIPCMCRSWANRKPRKSLLQAKFMGH